MIMTKHGNNYIINGKEFSLFMTAETISKLVAEMADRINKDYSGKSLVCILILKGAIFFGTDLLRQLKLDCRLESIRTSSYGAEMQSSGKVNISIPEFDIKDKDVLLIEDIVDSGRTLQVVMQRLKEYEPASLEAASFLSKPDKREMDIRVKYIAKEIPPVFVIGYGLDYDEQGRQLPDIYAYE